MARYKINFSGSGWTTYGTLYKDSSDNLFYETSTSAAAISCITPPTHPNLNYTGCWSGTGSAATQLIGADGAILTAFYELSVTASISIYVRGTEMTFGGVDDYFNLSSSTLIPESSDSGDTHQFTVAYNVAGKTNPGTGESSTSADTPATDTSCIWRNPRVTYRVVGDMTLAVTLGAAFAGATGIGSVLAQTGYMISSVEVHTAIGEPPTVTVTGVANEGHYYTSGGTLYADARPAIKTYSVSIPITARHRPQNLLSSVSGGGELQELTLVARGDPVVVAENGMPCASDMTHGRIEVTATTAAYNNESAPTAGTNFTKTAEPVAHSGVGYKTFSVAVRKELT